MEALVRTNKVHSIGIILAFVLTQGVSNFNTSQLQKLLETAEIPPAVNQIEIHPCPPQVMSSLIEQVADPTRVAPVLQG